ncbi:restriction endonuclease subunit S [Corynebacterium diphtheriae]|uniref:restriction endonuclease subunit S n=1 Tax=Corynebacterium diphtheriae TaxID=1717 RepID=UPI0008932ACE|nr:restriction endonuclease subunit S [Corynebacterium diphtheriae]OFI54077.1 restriction endonuclease subunit S [Corynebacterium diphtheriae]OSQ21209.1 restriction endonuclease subunit S [Corynebacterium diphtheriae]OWN39908.1 restriction endonuclease subunit S [Corynebacterium diphtheriae bv. gravis]OWN67778.1 restriction endonuclease subunit S [Corynebacterium diphtheriae bv. gravis]OWO21732.1 restriction endonuclease subunit S [Corynebacterium diphtheriae bv. gravis]
MTLTKYRLGELIEKVERLNTKGTFGAEDVRGISNTKEIQPTKADISNRNFKKFQVVSSSEFVFNRRTTRMGDKLGIGFNNLGRSFIVTEDYVVFKIARQDLLLPEYLNIFIRRAEFDRYVRWDSWGSATEFFNWEEIIEVPIVLPPIDIQQKYVDIYNALRQNSRLFEEAKSDLELAIEGYVDRVKRSSPMRKVGELLSEIDRRNHDGKVRRIRGIDISKRFIPSKAHVTKDAQRKYKIIHQGEFAYSAMQTGRDETIRIALKTDNEPFLVSPAYAVLAVKEQHEVLPEWIMLWFSRPESDRFGWFASDASVRASLELERFFEIEIPIPDMSTQFAVCNIYKQTIQRDVTANRVREQALEICPVLIRGSLAETTREEMP